MTASLRSAVGSLLVVGLSGPELTSLERAWLRVVQPGGIILFRRNIAGAAQTRALLAAATAHTAPHPMRAVDIEGGAVDRLRDAVAPMPAPQSVARTGKATLMRRHGQLIAQEALAFGFNTTLAPVLDLGLPISAAVMGTRTASPDPAQVTEYARNFLQGLATHGVTGCGKHFPGLGGGALDSHHATPSIPRTFPEMWATDLAPYRDLVHTLPMVMVNHAAYPATRSGDKPATASPYWVTTILRRKLAYPGLIFSDDLEMGGILNHLPIEDAILAAFRAGLHMAEICHSPELILRAFDSLLRHAESSAAFRRLILTRAAEAAKLRRSRYATPIPRALSATRLASLRDQILAFRATVDSAAPEAAQ